MQKITIQVEDDIPVILANLAGGQRKIGAFVSATARALHGQQQYDTDDLHMVQLVLGAVAGQCKQHSARLVDHDARLARLEAGTITLTER